jgi:hypothetical protein
MADTKTIYFILLLVSFILSLFSDWKNYKDLKVLALLLFFSIVSQALSNILHSITTGQKYNIVYNIYVPLEYCLYSYYFFLNFKNPLLRRIVLISIPLYLVVSFGLSIFMGFQKYPGLQINIEGIFVIIEAIIGLFSIEPKINSKITAIPFFWVCVAVLVYHSGIFTYMGLYSYIMEQRSSLGAKLNVYILHISNYILYICFSIAFVCSRLMKK